MTTLTETGVSAWTLSREFRRPWRTIYRWAEAADIWNAVGSGRSVWFTPEEAAGLRTLSRVSEVMGGVPGELAWAIVRERGPVLAIAAGGCASVEWEAVPDVLASLPAVVLVPVVEVES